MTSQEIEHYLGVYRDGLLLNTVPFWFPRCVDEEFGGYLTARGREGELLDDDKSVWAQGRDSWMLAKLYNTVEKREDWLAWARSGIDFLDKYCFDPADGRMWFQVTRDGKPLRKRRYAFSESFAAIAYAQYARAIGSDEYADKSRQCIQRFLDHVPPAKSTHLRPTRNIGTPMIGILTAQEIREAIQPPDIDELIDRSIDEIRRYFLKPDIRCVMETVGENGEILDHFDARTLNPGHAIEGAWAFLRESKVRKDSELLRTGCEMLDWMWDRGWDAEYGGMLYFRDVYDKPVQEYWQDMKFWWPHNETIIAALLAYQLTGKEKYAQMHKQVHDWSYQYFPDAEHGEWYGYLHRDGRISVPIKGNLWKGPFHLPRMELLCWRILEEMKAE